MTESKRTYEDERQRLLETVTTLDPTSPTYKTVMDRINELDLIMKRSSDKLKTIIPACMTVVSVASIYTIQQFAGVAIPKALEMLHSKSNRHEKD